MYFLGVYIKMNQCFRPKYEMAFTSTLRGQ